MATKTIKFLQGGGFVERQTNADTVEQLRGEFPDDILKDIIDIKNRQSVLKIKENKLIDELVNTEEEDNGN